MSKKVLIIDNSIDQPWKLGSDFRRYLHGETQVRRGPQGDFPKDLSGLTHVILSGSKTSCTDSAPWVSDLFNFVKKVIDAEIPLLGVCYGHQIIARLYGGDGAVGKSDTPEIGWVQVEQTEPHPLLQDVPKKFFTFQSHFEEVKALDKNFVATATSPRCPIQAFYHKKLPIYGVQFHPERNATEGQASIDYQKSNGVLSDCIFNDGRASTVYNENVAISLFHNFIHHQST